jgi:benzoylformate decarboxylase
LKTGKQAIIEQFLADGIRYMFGNPGTVEEGFLDVLEEYPDFQYIMALEEATAVAMADGYARKTKKPAVIQLHSGVGLGNGIGMIYQAMRGHAPLVIVAGEAGIKYDAMDSQMAADLVGMARPVTKWSTRVADSASLLRVLRRAIKMASTPPTGPVFVCLPLDILDLPLVEKITPTVVPLTRTAPDEAVLNKIAVILLQAQNPALIIGDGVAFSEAQPEVARLAALLGAAVWGADSSEVNISASNIHFKGLLGHMFGEVSKAALAKADTVLIIGTYIFPEVFPTLAEPFSPGTKLIHIDLNPYEIGKNFPVEIGVVAEPKLTLQKLIALCESSITPETANQAANRTEILVQDRKRASETQRQNYETAKNPSRITMAEFGEELSRQIPPDTIIFDEALTCSPELNFYIPADTPGNFFQTRGGSLGVGIPGALGIKLAAPDQTVIGFTGDGGGMYTIQALWTAAHYNIGAKFVICNNHSYRLLELNIDQYWKERQIPKHNYPQSFSIRNPNLDFVKIAEGHSVPAVRVENPGEIKSAITKMLTTEGPFLLEVVI